MASIYRPDGYSEEVTSQTDQQLLGDYAMSHAEALWPNPCRHVPDPSGLPPVCRGVRPDASLRQRVILS